MFDLYFKFKKDNSELNDDGFLLMDSLLSLMTLIIITNILLPALLVLVQYDSITQSQLKFNRELYISLSASQSLPERLLSSKLHVQHLAVSPITTTTAPPIFGVTNPAEGGR